MSDSPRTERPPATAVPGATDRARARRASRNVALVLIGSAALAACGQPPESEIRRDVYASLEECRADWDRADLCEAAPAGTQGTGSTSTGHRSGTMFYGPRYYADRAIDSTRARPGSKAMSSTSVSRGGFGASSRGFSAGS